MEAIGSKRACVLVFALVGAATTARATPALTRAEERCQAHASTLMVKFGRTVAKCGMRCQRDARRGAVPYADCLGPYGGAMATCLSDPVRGAQARAIAAIRRDCDPSTNPRADCPECYDGGDCAAWPADRVALVQGQLDSLGPAIYCDPGTVKARARCMDGVVASLSTLGRTVHACFDTCFATFRRRSEPSDACLPSQNADAKTIECVARAETIASTKIDELCAAPEGERPACFDGHDGAGWANLFVYAAAGNVPDKYCGSASAAFLE